MPFLKAGFNGRHVPVGIFGWTRARDAEKPRWALAEMIRFAAGDYAWHGERFLAWGESCVFGTVGELAAALDAAGFTDFGLQSQPLPDGPTRRPRPVTLVLPYPVSANRYWRHFGYNPRAGGKARAVTFVSEDGKAYREEVGWRAKAAGVRVPFTCHVEMVVRLVPENKVCMDLDNALKVTIDALKGIVYADDDQIMKITAERAPAEPGGKRLEVDVMPYSLPIALEKAA